MAAAIFASPVRSSIFPFYIGVLSMKHTRRSDFVKICKEPFLYLALNCPRGIFVDSFSNRFPPWGYEQIVSHLRTVQW